MLAADAPSEPLSWTSSNKAVRSIGLSGALVITGVSTALAVSLQPLQFRLVQLLEGYWPAWAPSALARIGMWSETRRRTRIPRRIAMSGVPTSPSARIAALERSQTAETQVRERFPETDRTLPTALGNALRASEDRAGARYGVESVVIWPRLFRVLPPDVRSALDDEVDQLDVSARLTVTWSIAATVGTLIVLHDPSGLWENPSWAALVGGLWVLSRLSYLAAVESAVAHGLDVEVAIDLYRARVVDAMRLPMPAKMSHERRLFRRLCRLFQAGGPTQQEFVFRIDRVDQPLDHQ